MDHRGGTRLPAWLPQSSRADLGRRSTLSAGDPVPRPHQGIFAGADIVATGVLQAVSEAGLAVPDDISIAGYDNTSFAALGPISLTSVDQAGRHIGANAAKLLLERIADRTRPTAQVKLSPTLVARRTTAPPPPA
ncbi:substrate-binding domain-containing protein [Streptomyces sp. NPDC003554]